nr:SDR family NAD(P)-dependent oxidoreductase [Nocardia arthritidis]
MLPLLREQGKGRVIVVSSGAGAIAEPYGSWYSATKAAVERIAVRVSTPISAYDHDRAAVPNRVRGYLAAGQPTAAVARNVAAILAADRPRECYLYGRDVRLSSWSRRLVPGPIYERMVRRYYGFRSNGLRRSGMRS